MQKITIFSFLLFVNTAFAQIKTAEEAKALPEFPKFEFGITAGINYGTPLPTKPINEGDKGSLGNNPRIGLQAQYNINKRFSVLAEWAYSRKSAAFESLLVNQIQTVTIPLSFPPYSYTGLIEISGTSKGAFDLEYIEFQLLPQYHFNKRLSACLGAYGADLWRGTNKITISDWHLGISTQIQEDMIVDNSAEIKRFDYGAVAGVSYKLFNNLHINLRATRGFTSIYKPTFTQVDYEVRNTYLQFGADFRLPSRPEKYGLVY